MKYTLLALLFASLLLSASAHRSNTPFSVNRIKRQSSAPPSTCSFMQCAVSRGNCGASGASLTFCQLGEHCDGSACITDLPIGSTCNPAAFENECAQGTCVDTGNGPVCQIYRSVLPGGACNSDSQCYFSAKGDGSDVSGTCNSNGVCQGLNVGDMCQADNQCPIGSFCSSSSSQCTLLGGLTATCSDDSECQDRYTCLAGKCAAFYTQGQGQACSTTDNCASNLYCKAGTCAPALDQDRSATQCDILTNNCGSDMQCSCANYTSSGTTATCAPIKGTYGSMPTIQQAAFDCLDKNSCGSDISLPETAKCIADNCKVQYCTWVTRTAPELFEEYPTCLVSRMLGNSDYASFITQSCPDFRPIRGADSTSAASPLAVSASLLVVAVAALLAF